MYTWAASTVMFPQCRLSRAFTVEYGGAAPTLKRLVPACDVEKPRLAFNINSWGHFNQGDAFASQSNDAAFGNV